MRPRFALALAICVLVGVSSMQAQVNMDRELLLDDTKARIQNTENVLPMWESAASWHWRVSVGVMLLGLLSSALAAIKALKRQGNKPRGRRAAVAEDKALSVPVVAAILIGLAVTGLTWWLQNGFAADRRGYRKAIIQATGVIGQIKTRMEVYRSRSFDKVPDDLLNYLSTEITPLADKLQALQENLVAQAVMPLGTTVYAQGLREVFSATGTGGCNLLAQAEEQSRVAAVEKLVASLSKDAALGVTSANRDTLREYVAKYATRSQSGNLDKFQTTLTLNPTFTNPRVLGPFLQSGKSTASVSREQRIDVIRRQVSSSNPNAEVDGFLETSATIPPQGGVVTLQARDRKKGSFVFTFSMDPTGQGTARLALRGIEINEDASGGSTRWSFEVLSGGTIILSLPVQRWDDSAKPTKCSFDADAGFFATVKSSTSGVPLTIVGLKPKVDSQNK
jgi:hypothetical protein